MIKSIVIPMVVLSAFCCGLLGQHVSVVYDPTLPTISFAADRLKAALVENNKEVRYVALSQLAKASSPVRIVIAQQNIAHMWDMVS